MNQTPNTPAAIIAETLRVAQVRIDRADEVINDPRALMDNVGIIVSEWTIAYLMGLLDLLNPTVAAAAATDLADAWDDGGAIHELVWEWRDDLAHARPIDSAGITFQRVIDGAR